MSRERFDNWCEKGILVLVLAMLVYGPLALGAVRMLDAIVLQSLTIGVLALWLLRFWINPQLRLLWPPICWPVLLFAGYAVLQYQHADIEYAARDELIRVLIYAFVFFAVLNNLNRQESATIVSFTLLIVALAVSAYAAYQFTTKSDFVWKILRPANYAGRGSGTYICPNHLAGFLEMVLPLGLAFTLAGRLGATVKIVLGYASLVILAGIGVANSRGGWLATGLALAVFFAILFGRRSMRLPALLLLAVLVAGGVWFVASGQHANSRFAQATSKGKFEDVRLQVWPAAIAIWRDHPWWGVGPAHFDHRFRQYRPEAVQMRPVRVHNDYLNTLADWGAAGAALVAAAWVLLFAGVWQVWKFVQRPSNDLASGRSNRAAFVLGAAVGLLAILIHSATDFNMHIPGNALIAVTLMALVTAHWRFATERFWISPGIAGRTLASVVLLTGIVYLGQQATTRAGELVLLDRAAKMASNSPRQVALLKQAHAAEPMNFETTHRIGEALRLRSFEGGDDHVALALEAMGWFREGMRLNPWDPYNPMRLGMCLDWIERGEEAGPWFERASQLDPQGYYQIAHLGWHYFQLGDYAKARTQFERSMRLEWNHNDLSKTYLEIIAQRMKEAEALKPPP